jgi:hypothetical protein
MNLSVTLGETETTHLIVQRNWITGHLFYVENGEMRNLKKPTRSGGNVLIKRNDTFDFVVGINEKHHIRLERIRPMIFGGIRPHCYELYVNDVLVKRYRGF